MADRVVAGLTFAGEGAAHRIPLELGAEHRVADDPLEEAPPTKRVAASVIRTRTPWPEA